MARKIVKCACGNVEHFTEEVRGACYENRYHQEKGVVTCTQKQKFFEADEITVKCGVCGADLDEIEIEGEFIVGGDETMKDRLWTLYSKTHKKEFNAREKFLEGLDAELAEKIRELFC